MMDKKILMWLTGVADSKPSGSTEELRIKAAALIELAGQIEESASDEQGKSEDIVE